LLKMAEPAWACRHERDSSPWSEGGRPRLLSLLGGRSSNAVSRSAVWHEVWISCGPQVPGDAQSIFPRWTYRFDPDSGVRHTGWRWAPATGTLDTAVDLPSAYS
jgi:hypothetical protein